MVQIPVVASRGKERRSALHRVEHAVDSLGWIQGRPIRSEVPVDSPALAVPGPLPMKLEGLDGEAQRFTVAARSVVVGQSVDHEGDPIGPLLAIDWHALAVGGSKPAAMLLIVEMRAKELVTLARVGEVRRVSRQTRAERVAVDHRRLHDQVLFATAVALAPGVDLGDEPTAFAIAAPFPELEALVVPCAA